MSTTNITPGWYPDPTGTRQRYFDGEQWIDAFAPPTAADPAPPTAADPAATQKKAGIGFGVIILGIVGNVMSGQSTSLMNGTGTIWLGVVIVAAALAAAFFLGAATWVKVVAALLLASSLFHAISMEMAMDEKRNEIGHVLDSSYRS